LIGMVIRKGPRRFLGPLAFYAAATACVGYFLYHAHHGERGLETKQELKVQLQELRQDLAQLKVERGEWDARVALMRRDELDSDLLDERARDVLGRVHRNDVVIISR
jgi:cell division protein FtsB